MEIAGLVSVKVKADLTEYRKGLADAKKDAETFDQQVADGMKKSAAASKQAGEEAQKAGDKIAAAADKANESTVKYRRGQYDVTKALVETSKEGVKWQTTAGAAAAAATNLSTAGTKVQGAFANAALQTKAYGNFLPTFTAALGAANIQTVSASAANENLAKAFTVTTRNTGLLSTALTYLRRIFRYAISDWVDGTTATLASRAAINGMSGSVNNLGSAFGALRVPAGAVLLVVLALGAAFIGAMRHAFQLDNQLAQIRVTMSGLSTATGLSASEVQDFTRQFGTLSNVTQRTAQEAATILLRNPLMSGALFKAVLPLSRDFAAVMGTTIPEAARTLGDALTGGYEGAKKLDDILNFLTADQLKQVRALDEQGKRAETLTFVLTALQGKLKGLADQGLTPTTAATNAMGNAWSHLLDSLAKTSVIQGAKNALTTFFKDLADMLNPSEVQKASLAIKQLQGQIEETLARIKRESSSRYYSVPGAQQTVVSNLTLQARQLLDALIALKKIPNLEENVGVMEALQRAADGTVTALSNVADEAMSTGNSAEIMRKKIQELVEQSDPTAREYDRLKNVIANLSQYLFDASINGNALYEVILKLKGAAAELPTFENLKDQLTARLGRVGMSPSERARSEAMDKYKSFPPDQQKTLADLEARIAGAQGGLGITDELRKMDMYAKGISRVIEAYKISTAEGQKAETALRALVDHYKEGGKVVDAYARALHEQELAQRRLEGAKQLAQLKEEVEDLDALTEALSKSTVEYDRQRIAIEAARKVKQGYFNDEMAAQYIADQTRKLRDQYAQEAIQLNRQYDPVAAFKDQVAKLVELEKTGKASAETLRAAYEDAYIKMGQAGSSWLDGAAAGLLDFARQARNVGQQVAQVMTDALGSATDAIVRLMLGMSVSIKSILQDLKYQILRIFVQSTITGPIAGFLGSTLAGFGLGGSAIGSVGGYGLSGSTISVGGIPYVPATGGGSGGLNPLSLFGLGGGSGGGGLFGNIGNWLSTPFTGAFSGISPASMAGVIPGMGGVDALNYFSGLSGSTAFTPLGTIGSLAGLGMGIMGLAQGNVVGGISGILSGGLGLASMAFPAMAGVLGPAGMIIGVLGGLLGGLFKKKPKTPQEVSNIDFNGTDFLSSIAYSRGRSLGTTAPASNALIDSMTQLFDAYNLTPQTGFPSGWMLNSIGKNTGNQWIVGTGTYGSFTPFPGKPGQTNVAGIGSVEEAVNILAAALFKQGAETGTIQGLTATMTQALTHGTIESLDDIKAALDFSKTWDAMVDGARKVTVAEQAIKQINEQFDALKVQAKGYGMDLSILEARRTEEQRKVGTDFNEQIRLALLAANDNSAYQRELLAQSQDSRMKEAQYIESLFPGLINFNDLIALNNKELSALEETLSAANDNIRNALQAALDRIRYGADISKYTNAQRYQMAYTEFTGLEQAALGGQSIDYDRLVGVADTLLQYAKVRFSVTEDYAVLAQRVEDLYTYLIGRPSYAEGGSAKDWAWVGERGKELALFSQPANIVPANDSQDLTGNVASLVNIGRSQASINVEVVKELRAVKAELAQLRADQQRQFNWDRSRGVIKTA